MFRCIKPILVASTIISVGSGCVVTRTLLDPFEKGDAAMMARVAAEMPFGERFTKWLEASQGNRIVVVNMEDHGYTDDELPEYLILDAFYTRMLDEKHDVTLLDRDRDLLHIISREIEGMEVSRKVYTAEEESDGLSASDRRAQLDAYFRDLTRIVAESDVAAQSGGPGRGDKGEAPSGPSLPSTVRSGLALPPGTTDFSQSLQSSEIGSNKLALLRELMSAYRDLYAEDVSGGKLVTRTITFDDGGLLSADYLVGYRIYDFGVHYDRTDSDAYRRTTYIKLHLRVLDVETGSVVMSDFMEHRIDDVVDPLDRGRLRDFKTEQRDHGRPGKR